MSVADFADFVGLSGRAIRTAIQEGRISCAFWNNGTRLVDVESALVEMKKEEKLTYYRSKVRDIVSGMDSEEISSKHLVVRSLRQKRSIEAPNRGDDILGKELQELKLKKLCAEAAFAELNHRRALGELIDLDKAEPIVIEAFSGFNGLLEQLGHQIASDIPGCRSEAELAEAIKKRMESTRARVFELVEAAKRQTDKAIEQQGKPLRR
jgi:hypothetical protein